MRKIPAALLSLALTASLTAPLASAAGTGSTLPELDGHWSQSAFERWHAYGIVEGDSRGMRPDANMTVGEFAAILSRAMGYTETVENPWSPFRWNPTPIISMAIKALALPTMPANSTTGAGRLRCRSPRIVIKI